MILLHNESASEQLIKVCVKNIEWSIFLGIKKYSTLNRLRKQKPTQLKQNSLIKQSPEHDKKEFLGINLGLGLGGGSNSPFINHQPSSIINSPIPMQQAIAGNLIHSQFPPQPTENPYLPMEIYSHAHSHFSSDNSHADTSPAELDGLVNEYTVSYPHNPNPFGNGIDNGNYLDYYPIQSNSSNTSPNNTLPPMNFTNVHPKFIPLLETLHSLQRIDRQQVLLSMIGGRCDWKNMGYTKLRDYVIDAAQHGYCSFGGSPPQESVLFFPPPFLPLPSFLFSSSLLLLFLLLSLSLSLPFLPLLFFSFPFPFLFPFLLPIVYPPVTSSIWG